MISNVLLIFGDMNSINFPLLSPDSEGSGLKFTLKVLFTPQNVCLQYCHGNNIPNESTHPSMSLLIWDILSRAAQVFHLPGHFLQLFQEASPASRGSNQLIGQSKSSPPYRCRSYPPDNLTLHPSLTHHQDTRH